MTEIRKERGMPEPDLSRAAWRRSAKSGGNGDCVEVASLEGAVAVRDSKNPDGPKLIFTPSAWQSFLARARRGSFDLG